jgi:hypothetical protein
MRKKTVLANFGQVSREAAKRAKFAGKYRTIGSEPKP